MRYKGSFPESEIPYLTGKYGQLLCYSNDEREIKIYYDINKPFFVKAIAVFTKNDGTNSIYDVYNYEYNTETDEEAKEHVKAIIETALKY